MNSLYNTDYHQWLSQQVTLLKTQNFNQLDLENLIEDLELSIKQDLRELENRLSTLLTHLLKCNYQTSVLRESTSTGRVLKGWMETIVRSRIKINKLVKENPSLTSRIEDSLKQAYVDGKKGAIKEMNIYVLKKLDNNSFPDECPWSYEQIMTEDWYPLNGV
ncbi:DUF29 domain-containing protein [Endozoicomonas sp. 8E]|uniref:DUF29 domain-containing protein n=1 Tax=Endozoicomonas sp. 8E TaxID=3035692 RepID=UPI00293916E0|nr:DUF29 domain-containing protein [Endozoicomonas sp. 8E]WOG28276.1 DUF29 domain-containing protein [Endozoicomonas sp. 8E]